MRIVMERPPDGRHDNEYPNDIQHSVHYSEIATPRIVSKASDLSKIVPFSERETVFHTFHGIQSPVTINDSAARYRSPFCILLWRLGSPGYGTISSQHVPDNPQTSHIPIGEFNQVLGRRDMTTDQLPVGTCRRFAKGIDLTEGNQPTLDRGVHATPGASPDRASSSSPAACSYRPPGASPSRSHNTPAPRPCPAHLPGP